MVKYTELRNKSRNNLIDVIPLEKPYTIAIDPSSLCNFRCSQCLQGQEEFRKKIPHSYMKFPVFKKIIDELNMWKGPKIKLLRLYNSGEPLLNPDFEKILYYLKDNKVSERVEITSNCSLLTENIAKAMVDSEVDYLKVSIYAIENSKQHLITKSNISIEEILENIKRLKEIRDKENKKKPFIAVKMFENITKDEKELFEKLYEDVADEIYYESLHDFTGQYVPEGVEVRKGKNVCPYPFYFSLIHSNGDVSCCCNDYFHGVVVGNVLEESLEKIWTDKVLRDFQKKQIEGKRKDISICKSCDVFLSDRFTPDCIDGLTMEVFNERLNYGG